MIDDGIHPLSPVGELHMLLPDELSPAFNEEWCSERKVEVLTKVRDEGDEGRASIMAGLMVEHIVENRELFRSSPVES